MHSRTWKFNCENLKLQNPNIKIHPEISTQNLKPPQTLSNMFPLEPNPKEYDTEAKCKVLQNETRQTSARFLLESLTRISNNLTQTISLKQNSTSKLGTIQTKWMKHKIAQISNLKFVKQLNPLHLPWRWSLRQEYRWPDSYTRMLYHSGQLH